jgi:hypothetical protein
MANIGQPQPSLAGQTVNNSQGKMQMLPYLALDAMYLLKDNPSIHIGNMCIFHFFLFNCLYH